MTEPTDILTSLSSNFLTVTLKGAGGWSPNAKIEGAEDVLASEYGGESKAFKGTENILPKPYNAEFLAMTKAFGAYRTAFYELTLPFAHTTGANGKAQADGTRLLAASLLANGRFINTLAQLEQELDTARTDCANTILQRVAEIQADGVLGSRFDPSRYPSQAEILAGWRYEPIVPQPLADGTKLRGMSIPGNMLTQIEAQMQAAATSQVRFGQQSLVEDTLKNVQTMATNLANLDEWFSKQEGRRPKIYDSLVTNLQDSVEKLRTYAIPGTPEGAKLTQLADEIEERLSLNTLSAGDFRTDHQITRRTAREADQLAKTVTSTLGALWGAQSPADEHTSTHLETVLDHEDQAQTAEAIQSEVNDLDALLEEWA